jgi:hypothetical protein
MKKEIMTTTEYKEKYIMMTADDYKKFKKTEIIKVISEFTEALKVCDIEFCTPYGDAWTWENEFNKWYKEQMKTDWYWFYSDIENEKSALMSRSKKWLVDYVVVLDLTFASMNEVLYKHKYHDCLENLRKMLRG